MDKQRTLSKEEVLDRLLAAAKECKDKQAAEKETNLPTGYLLGLLAKTSPKPWEYQIVTTVIRDGLPLAEKYTHRICNEHGSLMAETGGWEMEGRDPDFELASLAPSLAEEVIQLREVVAELKAQPAAATKAPAHPEYLETLQDYEDAPVGTVLERQRDAFGGRHLVKLDKVVHQSWYIPGIPGEFRDENLAGTRRRVLYWPEPEEVE